MQPRSSNQSTRLVLRQDPVQWPEMRVRLPHGADGVSVYALGSRLGGWLPGIMSGAGLRHGALPSIAPGSIPGPDHRLGRQAIKLYCPPQEGPAMEPARRGLSRVFCPDALPGLGSGAGGDSMSAEAREIYNRVFTWSKRMGVIPGSAFGRLYSAVTSRLRVDPYRLAETRHCRPLEALDQVGVIGSVKTIAFEMFR